MEDRGSSARKVTLLSTGPSSWPAPNPSSPVSGPATVPFQSTGRVRLCWGTHQSEPSRGPSSTQMSRGSAGISCIFRAGVVIVSERRVVRTSIVLPANGDTNMHLRYTVHAEFVCADIRTDFRSEGPLHRLHGAQSSHLAAEKSFPIPLTSSVPGNVGHRPIMVEPEITAFRMQVAKRQTANHFSQKHAPSFGLLLRSHFILPDVSNSGVSIPSHTPSIYRSCTALTPLCPHSGNVSPATLFGKQHTLAGDLKLLATSRLLDVRLEFLILECR